MEYLAERKRIWSIAGIAAMMGLAVATIALPTGWIVRQQFHLIDGQSLPGLNAFNSNSPIDPREHAAANAHPDDFDRQVSLAVQQTGKFNQNAPDGTGSPIVRALLALRAHFGDRPELSAHILRYMTTGDIQMARGQDELVLDSRPASKDTLKMAAENQTRISKTAVLALALKTARHGEALDPTNAYFTVMRAVALTGARRDAEALDAWKIAADKPKWDDYATEEVRARWGLLQDAQGTTSAISRQAIAASLLFPHYARMRDMARFAASCAIHQELVGDAAGGFALRRATARVGALMRSQSKPIIGNLVGIAMTKIASIRPGGTPTIATREDDHGQAEREAQYVAYLTKIDHPEEARWYVAEAQAATQVRSIISSANDVTGGGTEPLIKLMSWWAAGITLLLMAFWTLTLGGVAALAGRGRRIRAGQPLRYSVRFSGIVVAAALMTLLAVVVAHLVGDADTQTGCLVTALVVSPILVGFVGRLKRDQTWSRVGRETIKGFTALGVTAASLALLLGAAAATVGGIERLERALRFFLGNFDADGGPDAGIDWGAKIILGLVVLAVPLLTMFVLTIRSRIRRIPVSVGLTRGMRRGALPTASVLLLLYTVAIVGTRMQEAATETFVQSMTTDEGKFEAGLVNQSWPSKVTLDAPAPPKSADATPSTGAAN